MRKIFISVLIMTLPFFAFAAPDSLEGLKTAKFVVDLNQGDAKKLRTRVSLILQTIEDIESAGVKADVVVAVRGGASKYMTLTDAFVDYDDVRIKAEIFNLTDKLAKKGVKLEQCAVALSFLKIDPKEVHPKFEVVKNGYVSLIAYQNRGYALLPME